MNVMEDAVSEIVEKRKVAFLTVIVTGNEICEWQFYANSKQDFMQLLNEALSGKPVFPIELAQQHDPTWSAYKQFAQAK